MSWLSRLLPGGRVLGAPLLVHLGRVHGHAFAGVAGSIEASAQRWAAVARAVTAAVVDVSGGQATLGQVTVESSAPPTLTVLRPRPDLVAGRVYGALTAGAAHRRPTLWLGLPEGVFLGTLVDASQPFEATPEALGALVTSGRCTQLLLTDVRPTGATVSLQFSLYAALPVLRSSLAAGRRRLARLPRWKTAR